MTRTAFKNILSVKVNKNAGHWNIDPTPSKKYEIKKLLNEYMDLSVRIRV